MKNNSQDDLEKELELIFNWISVWEKKKNGYWKNKYAKKLAQHRVKMACC